MRLLALALCARALCDHCTIAQPAARSRVPYCSSLHGPFCPLVNGLDAKPRPAAKRVAEAAESGSSPTATTTDALVRDSVDAVVRAMRRRQRAGRDEIARARQGRGDDEDAAAVDDREGHASERTAGEAEHVAATTATEVIKVITLPRDAVGGGGGDVDLAAVLAQLRDAIVERLATEEEEEEEEEGGSGADRSRTDSEDGVEDGGAVEAAEAKEERRPLPPRSARQYHSRGEIAAAATAAAAAARQRKDAPPRRSHS